MKRDRYKVMIMTASVGLGHDQAANAIKKNLSNQYHNVEIEIVDFIEIFPSYLGGILKATYLKMIDMVPSWYNILYQGTTNLNRPSKVTSIFAYKYIKKIREMIEASNPDMILFTNPFPSTLVSHLKRKNKINIETATVITDYTVHGVWMDPTIDTYFVGSNILKQEMIEKGVVGSKIHATGIPIDQKFTAPVDRERVLSSLGLQKDLPTVLVMGGGLGLGSMEEILETTDSVDRGMQVIIVAGKNEALRNSLENRQYNEKHHVKVLGFCENIHELMGVSHLLISKAGGLTMTEAISKELPVLVFDPIPGQEVKNAQYFSDIGAAMYVKDLEELSGSIEDLLFINPEKREKMVKCCATIKKLDGAADISKIIVENMSHADYRDLFFL